MKKILIVLALGYAGVRPSYGQKKTVADTSRLSSKKGDGASRHVPEPYDKVIPSDAVTQQGLFIVHRVAEKYFFEIPDTLLGREILAVTRSRKTAAGAGNGGEIVNQKTLAFEKGPDNEIFVRVITLISRADSGQAISKAVSNSYMSPIGMALPIAAFGKDSVSSVVDVTEFFRTDNVLVGMDSRVKRRFQFGGQAADRSYIESIHSFPTNTEIRTMKTFMAPSGPPQSPRPGAPGLPDAEEAGALTVELNTSLLLLPKKPMLRRLYDPRVGYFEDQFTTYGDDQQKAEKQSFIVRWRLEPRPEDLERYKRGELVEPARPIVYYIDPATPKKWRPYLIEGINDWNKAFEQAGFKNAIMGKEWPEGDSSMSLEDARFSVLRYFASETQNAYGPNVHDPRSGEILESHIGWYHNVMQLLHNWYMIQCGAVDEKARTMTFDDSLMGTLIRFVASHEVGHTLGLRHNMGASSTVPVENLRNKAWVEANGHSPSIMDYARFNYVAQPEDHISEKGLMPRIGVYDKWAIQWGYTYTGVKSVKEDKKINNRWIVDSLGSDPRLWFGGEGMGDDPRSQAEDLGDNAMKAGAYGIRNLQRILLKLPVWTREEGDVYNNLREMYGQLMSQFSRYMRQAFENVGGKEETIRSVEEKGPVYAPTPKARQKEAVAFLNRELFATPHWLLNKDILNEIEEPEISVEDPLGHLQGIALGSLLSAGKLALLEANATRYGASATYGMDEMLDDLEKGIWSELTDHSPIDVYRRDLQKNFVVSLIRIIHPSAEQVDNAMRMGRPGPETTDIWSVVRAQLQELRGDIRVALPATRDKMSRYHLQDMLARIDEALNPNK